MVAKIKQQLEDERMLEHKVSVYSLFNCKTFVCIYTHVHIHTHTHTRARTHTHTHTHTHSRPTMMMRAMELWDLSPTLMSKRSLVLPYPLYTTVAIVTVLVERRM